MTYPLILASRSPRRRDLLRRAGYIFTCLDADIDEQPAAGEPPEELVCRLARAKAEFIRAGHAGNIILGADTVVTLDGVVYGKPGTLEEAEDMLLRFSGRTQAVLTGLCLLHPEKEIYLRCVTSRITFRKIGAREIREYFSLVNPLDKAGGYGIQSHGDMIISSLEGSLSNVIGLPMEALPDWMKDLTGHRSSPEAS